MVGRIPQETIDEIRRRVEIAEVISDYLPLKRAGRNLRGLCPFHAEKTPSFMVSPDRQAYHCFGCGAGGNAISFVMEYEKVSFVEALTSLARRAGVKLPERVRTDPAERRENDAVYETLRLADEFFRRTLAEPAAGKSARDYLARRGLGAETTQTFGVGFAPASWDALSREARRRTIPPEILVKAGLARPRESAEARAAAEPRGADAPSPPAAAAPQGHYDYFRGRLMFPIAGLAGRVVGFGGRALGDEEPKYLNSPETPVFHKGQNLYGLGQTRGEIRNRHLAVLVEGYMDFLSLYEAGARNMVAGLGTAFTLEQARLLARYAPAAVLAYDGDEAGRRAAWQAGPLLWEGGLRARVVLLPSGEDPDSFVRREGLPAWEETVEKAAEFVDFALAEGQSPEEREEALKRLVFALSRVRDEIRRGLLLQAVVERSGLPEETVLRAVKDEMRRLQRRGDEPGEARAAQEAADGRAAGAPGTPGPAMEEAERGLLRLLLQFPELQPELATALEPDLFRIPGHRELVRRLAGAIRAGRTTSADEILAEAGDPAMAAAAAAAVVIPDSETDEHEEVRETERRRRRALADYVRRLRERAADDGIKQVQEKLRGAQARGDVAEAMALLRAVHDLQRQRIEIGTDR